MKGQGVVWDQKYKQDRENPERTSHMPTNLTPQIINAAIVGFEQEKLRIDTQIAELRAMLDGGSTKPTLSARPEAPTVKRRKFSAAARRRMKEAQRLRWAKIRGESAPPSPVTTEKSKPKRKLSKEGRAAIVAALKKRWREKKAASVKAAPAVAKKTAVKKTATKKAPAKAAKKAAATKTAPASAQARTETAA
jgi:DNA-binding protein HU-beta